LNHLEYVLPNEIEKRSFEIIAQELGERQISEEIKPIVMRVIHTTADFDYYENLYFSENIVSVFENAVRNGAVIVTDTNMTKSGVNQGALKRHHCECQCFMADPDIADAAKQKQITRAAASVDKAELLDRPVIYAVGNAPTALIRICEHVAAGTFRPELVIGVPVGFVNVIQSKEMLIASGVPCIVAKGRKGGSTVAAAICNALLYMSDVKKESSKVK